MTGFVDGGRARDVIDLDFSRAAQGSGPDLLPLGVVMAQLHSEQHSQISLLTLLWAQAAWGPSSLRITK